MNTARLVTAGETGDATPRSSKVLYLVAASASEWTMVGSALVHSLTLIATKFDRRSETRRSYERERVEPLGKHCGHSPGQQSTRWRSQLPNGGVLFP